MANFSIAIDYVLGNEKGLEENPNDPGGITNLGISLRFLRSLDSKKYPFLTSTIDEDTIKQLTLEQAKAIYFNEFWNAARFEDLTNQTIVNYLFDMAVNMGISPAIKCLQRACWSVFQSRQALVEDGILGDKTIHFINDHPGYWIEILAAMRSERAGDYRVIGVIHPLEKEFIEGWLNRAYEK